MIPSDHLRRKRWKTFIYETKAYDEYDPTETSDLPDYYSSNEPTSPSASPPPPPPRYMVTEFDMAYPSSISGHALPSDLPDHAFDGINLCHHLWQDMAICQLYRKYDKHCQREMLDFLKCRHRRDKAVALRALQFETWKIMQDADEQRRMEEIRSRQHEAEQHLAQAFKEGNVTEQRRRENDLAFLDQRMLWIEKAMRIKHENGDRTATSSAEEVESRR